MLNVAANIFYVLLIVNIVFCENDCTPYNQLVRENLKDIASDYLISIDESISEENYTNFYKKSETQFFKEKLVFLRNILVQIVSKKSNKN